MGGDISQQTDVQAEVLDEQGHKTGQILDRSVVHERELWHETVNVWIINSRSEVLLQLRGPKVELNPNTWDVAIGTHVRPQEDPTESALRCLETELGVVVTKDQLKHLFNIQSANPLEGGKSHRTLGHVFLLRRDIDINDFAYDKGKIAMLMWRPLLDVMSEVGSTDASHKYFPRTGNYYPQLFEALQAEMV
jgi:isopentenyl-diphosphate Delta-isomerase